MAVHVRSLLRRAPPCSARGMIASLSWLCFSPTDRLITLTNVTAYGFLREGNR